MSENQVHLYLGIGQLVAVLNDRYPLSPEHRLYYRSRRYPSSAFTLLVDVLRAHDEWLEWRHCASRPTAIHKHALQRSAKEDA